MKTYAKIISVGVGIVAFATSCQCKICTKDGENTVNVCRDNYNSDDAYNDAVGYYQLGGYDCK